LRPGLWQREHDRLFGRCGRGRSVASQALVVADYVAPLHQVHAGDLVDLGDRGAHQVTPLGFTARAHLDLRRDFVRHSRGVLKGEENCRLGADGKWGVEDQADAGGAGVDQATAHLPFLREAFGRGVAFEAVDEAALLAASDGDERAQDAAQLDQPQQRHDHRGDAR
jgi:hypothetical protein